MLKLTIEEHKFTFDQLKILLLVVNDMIYGGQVVGRKRGSGKKLECLDCMHCKTRVFESKEDLLSWCGRKSIKPNATWIKEIVDLGRLRLLWCDKQTDQFSSHGFSPWNASPRHTADIERILKEEKCGVFISSKCRDPFIHGPWDICPFRSV